jgi:hypothetical protein
MLTPRDFEWAGCQRLRYGPYDTAISVYCALARHGVVTAMCFPFAIVPLSRPSSVAPIVVDMLIPDVRAHPERTCL